VIDFEKLEAIPPSTFQDANPYPWINLQGALSDESFESLRDVLPDVSGFNKFFSKERQFGQKSHDRYVLEYNRDLKLAQPWKKFIEELEGPSYRGWLGRMLGTPHFLLSYHWHYTPNGCSVSPHCDSKLKLGSHIFYFNTEKDWDSDWGGQTLILDNHGRFDPKSSPHFDEFDNAISAESIGNYSLLFGRRGNSWHGVREIKCPKDRLRKIFIVVINDNSPVRRFKRWIKGKPLPGY